MAINNKISENTCILNDILETFYQSTHIPIKYIDSKGKTLCKKGEEEIFCNLFHEYLKDASLCEQTHLYSSRHAYKLGSPFTYFCPAGLTEISYPIVHEGLFCGAIIAGPMVMNYVDEAMVDEILHKNEINIKHKGNIKNYLQRISVVAPRRVEFLGKLVELISLKLIQEDHQKLKDHYFKMEQQCKIGEMVHSIKSEGALSMIYPYQKEKALLDNVKNGNLTSAKSILNELLGYVFYSSSNSIEIVKARALEISSLLSRAAVEGGAELTKIFGMNYQFINELNTIYSVDDITYWVLKVLNRFTESVINLDNTHNPVPLKKAIQYINSHYKKHITLKDVSKEANLTPKYLSSLFKKEKGISFTQYVNKLRVNDARSLLSMTNQTIMDIALDLGFEDPSYFTKIFKRFTGLTPNQYRKLNT